MVIVEAHALDLLSVGLDFELLCDGFGPVTENLNRTWAVGLGQACEEKVALVADQNLRVGYVFLVAEQLLHGTRSLALTDATVTACGVDRGQCLRGLLVAGN